MGNEPQYSIGHFAAFLCLFMPLEVFVDELLIGHVIVAVHVASDVHYRTFINIEIHLPHVCTLNKFIDIFL